MAIMFPERLPDDVESDAERRIFDQFRDSFGDDFTVFAGVAWLSKKRGGGAFHGEADFVVAHPKHGILVLEVKGGGVEYDAQAGSWHSTDRHGNRNKIKDPFRQARNSMYVLRRKLNEATITAKYRYPTAYAVAFPDIHLEGDVGVGAPAEIVLDLSRTRQLKQSVINVYRHYRRREDDPGPDAIAALTELFGRSWKVETIVGAELDRGEILVRELTEKQYGLLDFLASRPRALIAGCAGTGKTPLAVEKARRLAQEGFRVLFTCFNSNLALWTERQFAGSDVVAKNFHSLCYEFAERAGCPIERGSDENDATFFARFPDALLDATKKSEERFDAIVVDEGQDFVDEWWVALTALLVDPEGGILYIFYDDNQKIYQRAGAMPIADTPFSLHENCRNTQEIHGAVMQFYDGSVPPICMGPRGEPPGIIMPAKGESERDAVVSRIDWLVREQQVRPQDIAILTPHGREHSVWRHSSSRHWPLTWDLRKGDEEVVCSSIYAFKGLERPVVVVTELQGVDRVNQAKLLYVAFSRARQYLYVAGLNLDAVQSLNDESRGD